MSKDKVPSTIKVKKANGATGELASGALEKFTIVAFSDESATVARGVFVASFNPSTFSVNHATTFDEGKETNKGTAAQKFKHRNPRSFSVELFFDGTGTSPSSKNSSVSQISSLFENSVKGAIDRQLDAQKKEEENAAKDNKSSQKNLVDKQVSDFLTVCYDVDGTQHKPPFLIFVWGTFYFAGVLESANVSYSLFSSNGAPLRAKITISAKEHIGEKKINEILRLRSPDLTQSRIVAAGDTLANLSQKMYKDPSLYLELAKANNLTNYRKLKPGTELIFPPIEKIKGRA